MDDILAEARRLSPRYPDAEEARLRLQRAREQFTARLFMGLTVIFLIGAPFAEHGVWMTYAALACLAGFCITCFVAGNRAWRRNGGKFP